MKFNESMLELYLVAGTKDFADEAEFLPQIERLLKAGVTAFQLREKGQASIHDRTQLVILAKQCQLLAKQYKVPFFIDDDVDLAIEIKADGIHVGQEDEQIESVIERVGGQMMIGLSCNTHAQVQAANQLSGIDYLGIGTVFETQSKDDAGEALGCEKLQELVELSNYPVVAIGGISPDTVTSVMETGAKGVASISMFTKMKDPNIEIENLRKIINR